MENTLRGPGPVGGYVLLGTIGAVRDGVIICEKCETPLENDVCPKCKRWVVCIRNNNNVFFLFGAIAEIKDAIVKSRKNKTDMWCVLCKAPIRDNECYQCGRVAAIYEPDTEIAQSIVNMMSRDTPRHRPVFLEINATYSP